MFSSSLVVFSVAGSDPAPAAALQSVGKGAERRRAGEQVSLFVFNMVMFVSFFL